LGALPQAPEVYRFEALVERGSAVKEKRLQGNWSRWLNHSTEGLPTPLRLRFRRALSCAGARPAKPPWAP